MWSEASGQTAGRRHDQPMEIACYVVPVVIARRCFFLSRRVRILREYERAVIFRLGRSARAIFNPGDGSGPGVVLLIPFVDKMVKVSLRTVAIDVAAPGRHHARQRLDQGQRGDLLPGHRSRAAPWSQVEDYLYATSQIAQTTLRSVLGQVELDDLLAARDKINQQLQRIIDEHTEPWGVKVTTVEVQADRPAPGHAAGDVQAGRGRARAARQGHQRRGRVPGRRQARPRPPRC